MEVYREKRIPNNGIRCRCVITWPFAFGLFSASSLRARAPSWIAGAPPWIAIATAALIEATASVKKIRGLDLSIQLLLHNAREISTSPASPSLCPFVALILLSSPISALLLARKKGRPMTAALFF
jgi:hypothetical protein